MRGTWTLDSATVTVALFERLFRTAYDAVRAEAQHRLLDFAAPELDDHEVVMT
ncbi:hypothetical protein [Kribbella italica]|uniref:Uncharacterized protein n=1 Tax=Kribbella italica TaxID=1540520 RepID=A0A7W9JDM4_9ACTN|nr:hypothetical protein [Kribbella italica]MBB5840173.1 hypothetical protein [Kribbella italica]